MLTLVTDLYLAWSSRVSSCRPRSMNWTGGRLHRHAKSNNKSELKAQRQHFARASLNNLVAARSEASNRPTGHSLASLRDVGLRERRASDIAVQGYNPYETHFHGSCSTAFTTYSDLVAIEWDMC